MKNKIIKIILTILFISSYSSEISAQNIFDEIRAGVFIDFGIATNSITLNDETNLKFILNNSNNLGYAGQYGLFATVPAFEINKNKFYAGIRTLYLSHNYEFNDDENKINIKKNFDWFAIEPMLQFDFWKNFTASAGLQLNFPLNSTGQINLAQNNQLNTFNYESNLHCKLHLGVGYIIPFSKNKAFSIVPKFNFLLGLNNMIDRDFGNWNSNIWTLGIAFQYDNEKVKIKKSAIRKYENNIEIDTVRISVQLGSERIRVGKPILLDSVVTVVNTDKNEFLITHNFKRVDTLFIPVTEIFEFDVEIFATDANQNEKLVDKNFQLEIDEILVTEAQPLLNYIFFERNSSALSSRYKTLRNAAATANFDIDIVKSQTEDWNSLAAYYQVLNIVGQRMRQNHSYSLTIEGCNDGYTDGELDNLDLSLARAETVKNYLRNIWQISESRLTVTSRGLPSNPSLSEHEVLKQQENRRVELIPNDFSLFDPISFESKQLVKNIENLILRGKILSGNEITNYTINVNNGFVVLNSRPVNNPNFANNEVKIEYNLDINFMPEQAVAAGNSNLLSKSDYRISVIATDKNHRNKLFSATIPIHFTTTTAFENMHKQIHKYSLILFDFNTYRNGDHNSRIIRNIIDRTNPDSRVEIKGFADITEREEVNLRLSLQRAESAQRVLNFKNSTAVAADNSILLFDNDLPEGRFYSRTVEIKVFPPDK